MLCLNCGEGLGPRELTTIGVIAVCPVCRLIYLPEDQSCPTFMVDSAAGLDSPRTPNA